MSPVHTTTPPQQPNPSNYEKGNIYVSPASDETANEPNDIANYGDKEKTIVDPSGDSGKKPEGVFVTKKALQIGGAALAGIVALSVGIATFNNKDKKEDPRPTETIESTYEEEPTTINEEKITTTSTTINPVSTETTSPLTTETTAQSESDPSKVAQNAVEGYGFSKLSPEQQETIKKYEALSVEEFRKLPIEEQLIFSSFVFENYKPTFDEIINAQLTKDELNNIYYTANPTTPEQVLANYSYLMTMSCNVYELDEEEFPYKDRELGKKLVSLIKTISEEHTSASDYFIDNVDYLACVALNLSMIEGEFKQNDDGSYIINTIMHSNNYIEVEPDAEFSQKTFIEQKYLNINKEQSEIYLLSWASAKSDSTYVPLS